MTSCPATIRFAGVLPHGRMLPNRRIVVPPATPGRSCSPASKPYSRSGAPTAGGGSASSPSSPILRPCATSSSIAANAPRRRASHRPAARRCGTCPRPGRASATPTPSRHPSTRSINASPGNLDRRPPAAYDAGLARAGGRHAQPARTAVGAPLPRSAEKHPHHGAQPSPLPARSPASTADSLIR